AGGRHTHPHLPLAQSRWKREFRGSADAGNDRVRSTVTAGGGPAGSRIAVFVRPATVRERSTSGVASLRGPDDSHSILSIQGLQPVQTEHRTNQPERASVRFAGRCTTNRGLVPSG